VNDAVVGLDVGFGDFDAVDEVAASEDQLLASDRRDRASGEQLGEAELAIDNMQVTDVGQLVIRQVIEVDGLGAVPSVFARSEHGERTRRCAVEALVSAFEQVGAGTQVRLATKQAVDRGVAVGVGQADRFRDVVGNAVVAALRQSEEHRCEHSEHGERQPDDLFIG